MPILARPEEPPAMLTTRSPSSTRYPTSVSEKTLTAIPHTGGSGTKNTSKKSGWLSNALCYGTVALGITGALQLGMDYADSIQRDKHIQRIEA